MGNQTFAKLAKQSFKFFKVYHVPEYRTFTPSHGLDDSRSARPIHLTQVGGATQKKQEGLWFQITAGAETSKYSFIRTWARRRLREAMLQELKAHGYDENGKVIIAKGHLKNAQGQAHSFRLAQRQDITGSLRLHILPPLVPAKFVDVKAEVSKVVQTLDEEARRAVLAPFERMNKLNGRPQMKLKKMISTR